MHPTIEREEFLVKQLFAEQARVFRAGAAFVALYVLVSTAAYAWLDLTYPENAKLEPLVILVDVALAYVLLVALMMRAGYFIGGKLGGVLTYILVGTVTGLITLLGLVLLVVPGIYLAARLAPAIPGAMVSGLGPFAATKEAWQITDGHTGAVMLSMLGAFACFAATLGLFLWSGYSATFSWREFYVAADFFGAIATVWLTVSTIAALGELSRRVDLPT